MFFELENGQFFCKISLILLLGYPGNSWMGNLGRPYFSSPEFEVPEFGRIPGKDPKKVPVVARICWTCLFQATHLTSSKG